MSKINGYKNEFEFVKYLNDKKVSELNPMFQDLINELYPNINKDYTIKCWKNHFDQKSDIFIKINGQIEGISIKKGIKNSIHVERITDFIHFLISNGVSKENVVEYLKYHYADGSTNGKGCNRKSSEEYKLDNQTKIDRINKELNNTTILEKAIDRFIIRGNNSNYDISALIYGEVDDFIWIKKEDIKQIIMSKRNIYSTSVHFSLLTVQPKNRCLNYNPQYEKDRFCVQIKWYNLFDDIIENMYIKSINKIR